MQHGMGGWLDLTQQGLSPCKKYKTSWRSFVKSYRIIELVPLFIIPSGYWHLIGFVLSVILYMSGENPF